MADPVKPEPERASGGMTDPDKPEPERVSGGMTDPDKPELERASGGMVDPDKPELERASGGMVDPDKSELERASGGMADPDKSELERESGGLEPVRTTRQVCGSHQDKVEIFGCGVVNIMMNQEPKGKMTVRSEERNIRSIYSTQLAGILPNYMLQYQKDFLNLFVTTMPFTACDSTLREHHVLMITGAPGSGKTMIAQQLMVKLWDVNKCRPFRVTKPSEYSKNCNPEIPQVFHIDDVFGSSNFVKGKYDAWVPVFGNMRDDLRSNNTFIIFTSRDNILNANLMDLKNYEVFRHVINVSDEKFKLSNRNKIDIFENHAKANRLGIEYDEIEDRTQMKDDSTQAMLDPMGYPQRVRLLCAMKDLTTESRIRFFRHPMEFLSSIIGSYREKDHLSYCVLILLLMHDGKLPVSFLHSSNKSSKQVQTCFDICDLSESITMGALRSTANNLCGSFLLLIDGFFVFQHESIMEAVTLDFGQIYPSYILDRCSIQFLLERVFTKDSAPPENGYVVVLQQDTFPQLCRRLMKEIRRCVNVEGKTSSRGPGWYATCLRSLSAYRVLGDCAFFPLFLQSLMQTDSCHLLLTSSSPDSQHPTSLFLAAAFGQKVLVQEVVSSYLCNVQQLPGFRDHVDCILYAACFSGSPALVKALLAAGARADYRTAHDFDHVRSGFWDEFPICTTLMHAAYSGSIEVMRVVLDHLQQQQRVDLVEHVDIRDDWGRTALHWGAEGGLGATTLRFLLDAGATFNARNNEGQTALHCASERSNEAAILALLDAGSDVNVRDKEGQTALHWSARHGDDVAMHMLLGVGADVHTRDKHGQVTLHWSAWRGDEGAVHALLEAGANVHARDYRGRTALHDAAECGHVDTVRLLVEAGADIHLKASASYLYNPYTDQTPLELAVIRGCTTVSGFFLSLITDVFLDSCSLQILVKHVFTKESAPPENEYVVILQQARFPQLCARLVKDIQRCVCVEVEGSSGWGDPISLRSMSAYCVFRDSAFLHTFFCHLQQTNSFHLLLTSSSTDSAHPTFLFRAALSGQDALIHEVFSSYLRDLQRVKGFSDHLDRIMYAACNSGSPAAVNALLAAGARVDCRTAHAPDDLGWWYEPPNCTTLMHAAYSGSVEVMRIVVDHLQKKEDMAEHICIREGRERMSLHWGVLGRCGAATLKILLAAGADVNARDEVGQTALHWSSQHGDEAAILALLEAGADVHARDKEGHSALLFCAQYSTGTRPASDGGQHEG